MGSPRRRRYRGWCVVSRTIDQLVTLRRRARPFSSGRVGAVARGAGRQERNGVRFRRKGLHPGTAAKVVHTASSKVALAECSAVVARFQAHSYQRGHTLAKKQKSVKTIPPRAGDILWVCLPNLLHIPQKLVP